MARILRGVFTMARQNSRQYNILYGPTSSARISGNTRIVNNGSTVSIRYHYTDIVKVNRDEMTIELNSNGWETVTTKAKMNLFLANVGCSIFQQKFQWYLRDASGATHEYHDGMKLNSDGIVLE
jgi:hypothetical protein